ncbi:MAG: helix-turn-helix domain-containing protein [Negativicutes bacterium]|nr:helix-turn-helix domain-containing protein [Negativicutes bacterium]
MLNLKDFRENKLKMTQKEFAELIGVRQDNVSRLEQSVEQIPLELLVRIANATGSTLDELVNYQRPAPKPLETKDTWRNADFTKRSIVDYIEEKTKNYRDTWGDNYDKYISELKESVVRIISKPKIAFVGHPNVGKSRLINSVLGAEKMPMSWEPTTSISVYIKHKKDKPSYIEEEAWIFKASVDNAIGWDEKKLRDEEYCRKWKLAGGNVDILKSYGTRQGEMYEKNEAGAAVIFVESDILKVCDLVDLPGFGSGDRVEDDAMTLKAKEYADVLIYMSHAGQFMQGGGIEYLKETINSLNVIESKKENHLNPLSNLFVLATHAHTVDGGNLNSLETILDNGCERFYKTLPDNYFINKSSISGYQYDKDVLRSRFFTYTADIEQLRSPFENELKCLIEALPNIINDKAKTFIGEFVKSTGLNLDKEIDEYTNIVNEREKYEYLLREIEKNEPKRANDNQNRRMDLISEINKMKHSSISQFADFYGKTLSEDTIVKIIKEKGFKKDKEVGELLVSYINSTLQGELQGILKSESENLADRIDQYVADFEGSIKFEMNADAFPNLKISFNATRAFASGLAGLATFGGLALWASTLGNLGAYILIAKGVSLLSAIGISVGGTAAGASAVAAIGGPIVLGIALAVIASISVYALLSGRWEKSLAKKIVKEYDKNKCLNEFKTSIEQFWSETEVAFNAAADSLEVEWKQYVNNLEEMVSTYDINKIQHRIRMAEEFKNFLQGIPL